MNKRTKRRAVIGGLVTVAVGGAGWYLNRARTRGHWLRPVESLDDSTTFAYVEGIIDRRGNNMDFEIAMRERRETDRHVEVFTDGDPVTDRIPPLRSYWRFEADVGGRSPGRYELAVGDAALPVELVEEVPARARADVRLTPRVTWRSDYVAHARGYSTDAGRGRIDVAFRERTGEGPTLDRIAFRDPEGRTVGRRPVPDGVYGLSLEVDPLTVYDADGELVGYRNGREIDAVPMFYH